MILKENFGGNFYSRVCEKKEGECFSIRGGKAKT